MSSYSKISSRLWTGKTGRALRDDRDAQVVAAYLLSSPHANMLGFYYLPAAYISTDTGIDLEGAFKALQRLCDEGFCRYDRGSEVVWVVGMARNQIGDELEVNDKRVKGVEREYASIPNNQFLKDFFDEYGNAYHMKTPRAFEAPSKPVAVTVAIAVAASATTAATATRKPSPGVEKPTPRRANGHESASLETWNAYANAYRQRYGVAPTRNKTVNGQIANFITRVPAAEAPDIAAFYVGSNRGLYVSAKHPINLLLRDAESLRTEWLTGKQGTETEARQADRTASTAKAFAPLIAEAEERERASGASK